MDHWEHDLTPAQRWIERGMYLLLAVCLLVAGVVLLIEARTLCNLIVDALVRVLLPLRQ